MPANASSNTNNASNNANTSADHTPTTAADTHSSSIDHDSASVDSDNRSDAASISSMPDLESVSCDSNASDSESDAGSDSDTSLPDLVPVTSDMEIASQRPVIPVPAHAAGAGLHSLNRVTQALAAMNLNPHGRRFRAVNRQDLIRRSAPNGAIEHRAHFPVYIHNYRRGIASYNPNRMRAPNPQGGTYPPPPTLGTCTPEPLRGGTRMVQPKTRCNSVGYSDQHPADYYECVTSCELATACTAMSNSNSVEGTSLQFGRVQRYYYECVTSYFTIYQRNVLSLPYKYEQRGSLNVNYLHSQMLLRYIYLELE
ncbi:hypothetical protein R3P38DRAFT_2805307 [Favolaschia claudopus]|uniref:Uncharacterized protein n=1 Tax=Favolaschia claudopus TaxID=2862362 RepID=A0AAV9ZMV1_9AGAR